MDFSQQNLPFAPFPAVTGSNGVPAPAFFPAASVPIAQFPPWPAQLLVGGPAFAPLDRGDAATSHPKRMRLVDIAAQTGQFPQHTYRKKDPLIYMIPKNWIKAAAKEIHLDERWKGEGGMPRARGMKVASKILQGLFIFEIFIFIFCCCPFALGVV